MGETVGISTNGGLHASSSADSSPAPSQDDPPPIAEPPEQSPFADSRSASSCTTLRQEKPNLPHTLSVSGVARSLATHVEHGLSSQEAAARLGRDGPNSIKAAKGTTIWEILIAQIANALTVVLIAVAALSFAIHDYVEGSVVIAVIVLNIVVG